MKQALLYSRLSAKAVIRVDGRTVPRLTLWIEYAVYSDLKVFFSRKARIFLSSDISNLMCCKSLSGNSS